MSQKLVMPFKKQMMLCGYKNTEYLNYWGYQHYGCDISTIQGGAGDDHNIYASGNGIVVACGKDPTLGYGICILYKDVEMNTGDIKENLVARYMHCKQMFVTQGQKVKKGDKIAVEGKEGTGDYHLHIEFDTDANYPQWTPQVAKRTNAFWIKGVDSTVNPSLIMYCDYDQEIVEPTYNPDWLNKEDFNIPKLEKPNVEEPEKPEKEPPLDSGTIGITELVGILKSQYSITNIDLSK